MNSIIHDPINVDVRSIPIADTGDYYSVVSLVDKYGKYLSHEDGEKELDITIANRLVSCWNACIGMTDPIKEIDDLQSNLQECLATIENQKDEYNILITKLNNLLSAAKLVNLELTSIHTSGKLKIAINDIEQVLNTDFCNRKVGR